ncbi:uncharacterized protein LOC115988969 [Quercus lobata]|uniref:uncharacterized protein LOC115988969 n=1 Tax=Quercus lobata TaxID=97700 RepID=UPI00124710BA|nr:uncharacterized protein LOC115988969 [Quercus lobata]
MLQLKLKHIEEGIAFSGRRAKTARSLGKKVQITVKQEISRILENLTWACLQQNNYSSADEHYNDLNANYLNGNIPHEWGSMQLEYLKVTPEFKSKQISDLFGEGSKFLSLRGVTYMSKLLLRSCNINL